MGAGIHVNAVALYDSPAATACGCQRGVCRPLSTMQELNRAFVTAAVHVELFVRDGWLIHIALMDDVKGHFEDLHVLIIDILHGFVPEHLLTEVLQHRRRYTNPSRPLCRVLRQLGNGNVVDGMYAAKDDSVYDKDIVHALTPSTVAGVDVMMVRRELKGLPPKSRKIDLACMYRTGATGSISEVREQLGSQAVAGLRQVYTAFATYGQRYNGTNGLDGARFTKLTVDCGLTGRGRRLKGTDVDLVFAQIRSKGARVVTFEQFVSALAALAQRANLSLTDIVQQVLQSEGPVTRATETLSVRFYDDKVCLLSTSTPRAADCYDDTLCCCLLSIAQCMSFASARASAAGGFVEQMRISLERLLCIQC
jgi:hypothetical protein